MDKSLLIVRFDDEKLSFLIEWKKLWFYKYGLGAIKKRVQELIEEDLKKFKKENKTGN